MINLQNHNTDVLLTNGWDRISYNVLRGLLKEKLKVAFGTAANKGMGAFSKYASSKFVHPDYISEPEEFISNISEKITQLKPRVYIPTGEEVFTIAKYIDKFNEQEVKIPISSFETLMSLHNKSSSVKLAESLDIPVPVSIVPSSVMDIIAFGNQFGYPLIVKNFFSSSSKAVYYIHKKNTDAEIQNLLLVNGLNFGEILLQQYVKGAGYGVSVLFNNGELKALFTHKRLRERIVAGGPSTLRMSTHHSELENYAVNLLKSVKFHGVAMVEFKYDEEKKQGWFIEVNPRFWGSVGLAINSGVNFPYLLYKMAVDGDVELIKEYKTNLKYKWLLGDISAVINQILSTKNPLAIKNLFHNKDGYDDFYKDDPIPFFAMIYLILKRNLKEKLIKLFK